MAKHEIFDALCGLFNGGDVEVRRDIANRVLELAIELFPDFRMSCEERTEAYSIRVENFDDFK